MKQPPYALLISLMAFSLLMLGISIASLLYSIWST